MTHYIVIEGADGTGTTTHTDLLTLALRSCGVDAVAFHHARPSLGNAWLDALDYARQRALLVASKPTALVVADRWHWSTLTEAAALASSSLDALHRAEWLRSPIALATFILDAPDDVLDARITARGEEVTHRDRIRRLAYRELAALPNNRDARSTHLVDTSRPVPEVTRDLLTATLAAIGVTL